MSDSIWRSIDTAEKSDYGKMECMEMTDVAIVGGGLCGILCAWFLKDAGVDCILLDKNRIAGGTGEGCDGTGNFSTWSNLQQVSRTRWCGEGKNVFSGE